MLHWISNFFTDTSERVSYSVSHMDIAQWGIVAAIGVFLGFLALRTRI